MRNLCLLQMYRYIYFEFILNESISARGATLSHPLLYKMKSNLATQLRTASGATIIEEGVCKVLSARIKQGNVKSIKFVNIDNL